MEFLETSLVLRAVLGIFVVYTAVSFFSFCIFLFYVGLRITNYPDIPEWWCGISGIVALFVVPFLASLAREWVKRKMKEESWGKRLQWEIFVNYFRFIIISSLSGKNNFKISFQTCKSP